MIMKFDHISFSCERKSVRSVSSISGYELQFQNFNLRNIDCKKIFFREPQQGHDIYLYEKVQDVPVEITAYDTCFQGEDSMDVENSTVIMYSPDPGKTSEFLASLGLKKMESCGDELFLEGKFALGRVSCAIRKVNAVEWKLDKTGWSSICFLSSDTKKELQRIQAAGYNVTSVEELTVNQKRMDIGFCTGPFGEIVEIISIKRG
ncbi:MAG: hypothetical protein NC331_00485 [Lachnospiraceae bacterium]|nr:hypothetical protein [Lachnospiraceae bacterium]MCM1237844.1 hypothetical protein [Lachnospiraceae bacterium]